MEKLDVQNVNITSLSNKFKCPHCGSEKGFEAGIVLDPFAGSGTTLQVAQRLGRKYIGIELNEKYIKIINKKLSQKNLF